jgi:hypothetical protein
MKKKNDPYNLEMRFTHKDQLYWENKMSTRCGNCTTTSLSLEDWMDLSLSLLSCLMPWSTLTPHKNQLWLGMGEGWLNVCLSTNPWGPIYSENKILECPCGLKGKLHLKKGSLIRLPIQRTRRHRTDRLLLHFHVTSAMMPCATPAVAPLPVLRQN